MVLTLEQGKTKAFSWNFNSIHMPRTTKFLLTKELTSKHLNASGFCFFFNLLWGACFFHEDTVTSLFENQAMLLKTELKFVF